MARSDSYGDTLAAVKTLRKYLGNYYPSPRSMQIAQAAAADLQVYKSDTNAATFATTAAFTEIARRGLQDTTDWTASAWKSLLVVSGQAGHFFAYVGPTAGGTETHDLEVSFDGKTETISWTLASGERPLLLGAYGAEGELVTAGYMYQPQAEALAASKASFSDIGGIGNLFLPPWRVVFLLNMPTLRFDQELTIRARHSANITNSTATAYSGIMYRLEP